MKICVIHALIFSFILFFCANVGISLAEEQEVYTDQDLNQYKGSPDSIHVKSFPSSVKTICIAVLERQLPKIGKVEANLGAEELEPGKRYSVGLTSSYSNDGKYIYERWVCDIYLDEWEKIWIVKSITKWLH